MAAAVGNDQGALEQMKNGIVSAGPAYDGSGLRGNRFEWGGFGEKEFCNS